MTQSKLVRPMILGCTLLLVFGGFGVGQNPYTTRGMPAPYYPGYPGGFYPGAVGGAYMGQADLVRAQGDLMIQTEEARVGREKANQEKLVTKRKSFDEMMFEKANTATLTEDLQYEVGLSTQRLMSSPQPAEITSGKTLNAMMPMINTLALKGTQGPSVPINPEKLKHLNVTVGKDGSNLGMLTSGGTNLDWPLCVRGPAQTKLASQIPMVVSNTRAGTLDQKSYRELTKEVASLKDDVRNKFKNEEIDGGEYLEANRFLDSLGKSVEALRSPTANRFLDGSYTARGRSVPELTYHMISNGLSFTACNPGDEAIYFAMHDMFVAYTTSAQAAAGFQVRYNPPRTDPYKNK